jgi:hypothetical protein
MQHSPIVAGQPRTTHDIVRGRGCRGGISRRRTNLMNAESFRDGTREDRGQMDGSSQRAPVPEGARDEVW